MSSRNRLVVVDVAAAAALAVAVCAPSAAIAAETSGPAVCVAQVMVHVSGIGMTPQPFTYNSGGPTGTIACVGQVNGSPVIGPGTVEDRGAGHGSCMGGSIKGFNIVKIPTADGDQNFQIPLEADFNGILGIRRSPDYYPGGFVFFPTAGDCISAPVTDVAVVIPGILLP